MVEAKTKVKKTGTESKVLNRVPAVNRKEYEDKISVIDKDVKQLKDKIQVLEKKIEARSKGKEEFFNSKTQIKSEMDEFDNRISVLENSRKELHERMQKLIRESKQASKDLKDMEKKIGFNSEAEVDERIAELEYKMNSETLTLKREKELISQIAQLKQTKPQIKKMNRMTSTSQTAGVENNIGAIKGELDKIMKKLNEQRDERRVFATKFRTLLDDRKKATDGLSELFDEKKALKEKVGTKIGEIKALRDERSAKIKEFNEYIAEQRKIREESDEKYKAARDAENTVKKLAAELDNDDVLPFSEEADLVSNTIKFCKSLVPQEDTVEVTKAQDLDEVEGTVALACKKDRDIEFFFNPLNAKKNKNKKKQNAKSASKALKYDLVTMNLFQNCNIEAPSKAEDLPPAIAALAKKLGDLKGKQMAELEERKGKREAREAALQKAMETARAAHEEADSAWKKASALQKGEEGIVS